MIKLKIVEVDEYDYTLEDIDNGKYNLNIEFYEFENIPKIGDYICLSEKILSEVTLYSFGPLNNSEEITEDELIKIVSNEGEYYLQRYYG